MESGYEERPFSGDPCAYAVDAAVGKARWVAERHSGIVIGADTVVAIGGTMLGKPTSEAQARLMLRQLSGRTHTVCTGICVIDAKTGRKRTACETTAVTFRSLSNEAIDGYLEAGEYRDKAGAYGIQGAGSRFVADVRGELTTVIGLPLPSLALLLREMGVPV